jgi:3-hydroxyacyl-[acyl-carrier-protein] dehydratase
MDQNSPHMYQTPADILKCLPHRYPFIFVDNVVSVNAGKSIVVEKHVAYADCFGTPKESTFPPEYIVEVFGQAAILLFYADEKGVGGSVVTLLVGVEAFEVHGAAVMGDRIEVEVRFEKVVSNAAIVSGRATVDGRLIAEGKLSAAFVSR